MLPPRTTSRSARPKLPGGCSRRGRRAGRRAEAPADAPAGRRASASEAPPADAPAEDDDAVGEAEARPGGCPRRGRFRSLRPSRSPAGSAPGRARRCARSHVTARRRRAPTRSSTVSTPIPRFSRRSSRAGVTTSSATARPTASGSARSSSPTATSCSGSSRCCTRASSRPRRAGASEQTAPLVVVEVPLLYETGGEARFDAVVVITAPEERARSADSGRERGRPPAAPAPRRGEGDVAPTSPT